ncbi:MAG: cell division protein ZapE [Rhizobiaceae bacterium]|nr:cell division protein ZapE [Rhizobiaceae bacterium]
MDDQSPVNLHNTVESAYEALVSTGQIESDPSQRELVGLLDSVAQRLVTKRLSRKSSALGWLFGKQEKAAEPLKGLYIWGSVGRGKSMLMDMFFDALPHKRKRRAHFNDFMQDAQERIHAHRQAFKDGKASEEDPIPVVARAMAEDTGVLCFDEFTVTDIADAMILGRLFETLFDEGVTIVATSNVEPQNLYRDGLNRKIFLPFIDLLLANVDVFELGSRTDYRLEKLNRAPVYLTPVTDDNRKIFDETWVDLAGTEKGAPEALELRGREFVVPMTGNNAARLTFDALCKTARSAEDYLALARRFHTVFIEDIPIMDRQDQNAAKRFILLIDTLYDNNIRIVALAETEPDGLYVAKSGTESFEFARTSSRLIEMQSVDYIAGYQQ